MRWTRATESSGPSTCTASDRRSIFTPSVSSISLRFSSRVPKRGSRFGVISRSAFRVPPGLPVGQHQGIRFSYGIHRRVEPGNCGDFTQKRIGRVHAGAYGTGAGLRPKRVGEGAQSSMYGERVAPVGSGVNATQVKIWGIVT